MKIQTNIPLLENILADWQSTIGEDYTGYRNHVYRMIHACWALHDCAPDEQEKIIIAAAFHDIGIWIENTVDYIPPSIPPAVAWLEEQGKADWTEEITLMISEHHKVRAYTDPRFPLVEVFRKGDLVDFSMGLFRFDVDKSLMQELKTTFPNAGFHKMLAKRAGRWFLKHPLNPAPMMKW